MISHSQNRVQAIKSKFENLTIEQPVPVAKKSSNPCKKYKLLNDVSVDRENAINIRGKYMELSTIASKFGSESDVSDDGAPQPNNSYLHNKGDVKRSVSDTRSILTRQTSDPGKKLQRRDAFRCDRKQKISGPKRHGSCSGRSESSDFSFKMNQKLSEDRLKKLGHFLEIQMKKDNFVPNSADSDYVGVVKEVSGPFNSIPNEAVPKHILEQYAQVVKPKKKDADKQEAMTDSGVSSETENLEEDKSRIKRLVSQYENNEPSTENKELLHVKTNLDSMEVLAASSETMRLEKKNPHLILTDTLKKALKQPLPAGPPPKKPPRTFNIPTIPETAEKDKSDTKRKLEKLEQVLLKRETLKSSKHDKNIYDVAEANLSVNKPKEIHYLCTEILDITHRTLLPNQNESPLSKCFNKLNCAITNNSMSSLPYTRLSPGLDSNRNSLKMCCSCSNESLNLNRQKNLASSMEKGLNTCPKCRNNVEKHDGFKCHLRCQCRMDQSNFFVDDEHIYDEPCDSEVRNSARSLYGTLNVSKFSKSMEDLRAKEKDSVTYGMPYEASPSAPATSEVVIAAAPKIDIKKLRQNFENGFPQSTPEEKPTYPKVERQKSALKLERNPDTDKLKSILINSKMKASKSTEDLFDENKYVKRISDKKFGTSVLEKRYRNRCEISSNIGMSLPKKSTLDVDKENLNRLMNEIYETVTAACNMDENKLGSFPTETSDGSTSEDSVKISRSLTEKRKNYVRRVSSRVAYLEPKSVKSTRFRHQTSVCSYKSEIIDNPYSTFRSWKSFRTSQNNLAKDKMDVTDSKVNLTDSSGNILSMSFGSSDPSIDNISIDEKTGCVDIELPFEPREMGLFNVCLLAGLNYMSGEAYVKSVFPSQVQVPPHIENLIFPETLSQPAAGEWAADAADAHCYSLVLTDERGERSYGYCRRVLPEGATTCLPLCYCIIGRYRAPGLYYKVLQEIESHHGSSEVEIQSILQQLFETDFPSPGEEITITYTQNKHTFDSTKSQTLPDMRQRESGQISKFETAKELSLMEFLEESEIRDLENNNGLKKVLIGLEGPRTRIIKNPIEPRIVEDNISYLVDTLGAGLVIKMFGSLLLERKVIVVGDQLSCVSRCMEALQSCLYPFVWQQPLISTLPSEIWRDVLEAPLPILAGVLRPQNDAELSPVNFHEGMLIDLQHPTKALIYQGDESSILPASLFKSLKSSLQMESCKNKPNKEDNSMRNVMMSEAFLRFYVQVLGDLWNYFTAEKDFDKESFIKNAPSKQHQCFLEWFTETAMFNHFIQNMTVLYRSRTEQNPSHSKESLVDTPLPNFYELFEERIKSKKSSAAKNIEGKSNYRNAVNKKVKLLKTKLRDLVA